MIRYFDMFAGIGGFRSGLTLAGGFECVGHCEIDRYADASYRAIHSIGKEERYYSDARKIDPADMPDFDLLCGGFPCRVVASSISFASSQRLKAHSFRCASLPNRTRCAGLRFGAKPCQSPTEWVWHGEEEQGSGRSFRRQAETEASGLCDDEGYRVEWMVLNSKQFGVPQSRRRVFIVCYLDSRCAGKILPVFGTDRKALVQILGGSQGSRVYDAIGVPAKSQILWGEEEQGSGRSFPRQRETEASGLCDDEVACTQTASAGGMGGKPGLYFVDLCKGHPTITDFSRCLTAKQNLGLTNYKGQTSGVLDATACAVISPEKENVRQNGRRIKNPDEAMFCLTATDRHGVLLIKEATKRGYKEALPGDSVDLGYSGSNTRRGRVGSDIAHTLDTGSTQGIVLRGGRIRRLMPRECLRLQGFSDEQIDKILAITSDAQAYKQAGNSVTVNVIHAIALKIKAVDDELKSEAAA